MKWPVRSIGSLAKFVGGGTPSKQRKEFWKGKIPWVSPKDMVARELFDTQDHITEGAAEQSSTQVVPAGSILIVVRSGILVRRFPVAIARKPVALNECEPVLRDDIRVFDGLRSVLYPRKHPVSL